MQKLPFFLAAGKGVSILLAVGFLLSLKAKDPRVLFVDVS
jgi:hypothetical protein